jgi:D-aminopeptidase
MADRVEVLPDARRLDDKRIMFTVDDAPTAYRVMRAAVALAKG